MMKNTYNLKNSRYFKIEDRIIYGINKKKRQNRNKKKESLIIEQTKSTIQSLGM